MTANLPDLEGLAIFAKVVESRSFAQAATDLGLSKATVSKAVIRLEKRLGARLVNRTSRRFALTEAGLGLAERATRILAAGEAAEAEMQAQSAAPRGRIRLAVPMSFGLRHVAPLIQEFLASYPEISVDLHLSDGLVDLIGEGFDIALRIATLPDSSLLARRLCGVKRLAVAAPDYLERRGRPTHPFQLADHACLGYAYLSNPDVWTFVNGSGEEATVRPAGPLRANNADALMPALLAGLGVAVQPDFVVGEAVAEGTLEVILTGWSLSLGGLYLVMPPGEPRPARIEVLAEFLRRRLARPRWQANSSVNLI